VRATADGVDLVADIELWLLHVVFVGVLALQAWAFIDTLIRKSAAFPAAGKLTKPAWALITALGLVVTALVRSPLNLIALVGVIASLVYLADVRPTVREISGGSRW
jgi:hypothetical protein